MGKNLYWNTVIKNGVPKNSDSVLVMVNVLKEGAYEKEIYYGVFVKDEGWYIVGHPEITHFDILGWKNVPKFASASA